MAFKINISDSKGKSWKIETESESLSGKFVGEKIDGKEISPDLEGYKLEITGGSDTAGFPLARDVEGIGLRKVLLTKGWGMRLNKPKGLRLRKTVRGKVISSAVVQINMKVIEEGSRKLDAVFPAQNKEKPKETPKAEQKEASAPTA